MKITIITVCYNSQNNIEQTLKSVLNQTYKNYEYLIIDGKSTDKTMDIVKKYEKIFDGKLKYISEKDKGIYDAMNKGIKMASGDVIGMLNSDDIYYDESSLEKINNAFLTNECDGVYSDLILSDNETMKKVVTYFKSNSGNYRLGWYPPHPTLYLKKKVYENYGYYNQDYKIAADYDFMLRIMKEKVNLFYIKSILVNMRSGGASTGGLKKYHEGNKEVYSILKNNNIHFKLIVLIIRILVSIKRRIIK